MPKGVTADGPVVPVYLEAGNTRVFACSLDWPGWCRRAKTDERALDDLAAYARSIRSGSQARRATFPGERSPRSTWSSASRGVAERRSHTSTSVRSGLRRNATASLSPLRRLSGWLRW